MCGSLPVRVSRGLVGCDMASIDKIVVIMRDLWIFVPVQSVSFSVSVCLSVSRWTDFCCGSLSL